LTKFLEIVTKLQYAVSAKMGRLGETQQIKFFQNSQKCLLTNLAQVPSPRGRVRVGADF